MVHEPTHDEQAMSIATAGLRQRVHLVAVVERVWCHDAPPYFCDVEVTDGTGTMALRFSGRRSGHDLEVGTELVVSGRLVDLAGHRCLWNPAYAVLDGTAESS